MSLWKNPELIEKTTICIPNYEDYPAIIVMQSRKIIVAMAVIILF